MDLNLQGSVAVVVGAAQGIGRAIALAFHREGASVVVIDREEAVTLFAEELNTEDLNTEDLNTEDLNTAELNTEELNTEDPGQSNQSNKSPALGLVADVTDYEAMRRAAQSVDVTFGRCDHVVYAVGVGSGKYGFPFWSLPIGRAF